MAARKPRRRAELAPHDRPLPARLALAQNGERGSHAQNARIGSVYPVYERAAQRTRERVAEASREERVDGLVLVIVIVIAATGGRTAARGTTSLPAALRGLGMPFRITEPTASTAITAPTAIIVVIVTA